MIYMFEIFVTKEYINAYIEDKVRDANKHRRAK